jgi:saccharopine dehydrogenase-like NADP-dependent oxidoreductase
MIHMSDYVQEFPTYLTGLMNKRAMAICIIDICGCSKLQISNLQDVPILLADAKDGAAVGQILRQTRVVLAMAGPYALYGDKVIATQITFKLDVVLLNA